MKIFKYFLQFTIVLSLFITFKIIGLQNASFVGSCLAKIFGPLFRSKKIIEKNLKICFKNIDQKKIKRISLGMWGNKVARDGIEPPTQAFSGLWLLGPCYFAQAQ